MSRADGYKSDTIPAILSMLKIILLGDCRVGKSSLVDRYGCKDGIDSEYDISGSSSFESNYNPTVGVKFYTTSYRGESVQFWDCSGHDSFSSLRASHFKEAHGYKHSIILHTSLF